MFNSDLPHLDNRNNAADIGTKRETKDCRANTVADHADSKQHINDVDGFSTVLLQVGGWDCMGVDGIYWLGEEKSTRSCGAGILITLMASPRY